MPTNNITLSEIAARLSAAKRMIVLTHERPDGDAIGCAYAVKCALPDCETYVLNASPLTGRLARIAGETDLSPERIPASFVPDLILCVDVASPELLGERLCAYASRVDIRIDHHATGQDFAAYNYTDGASASCGEILFDLLQEMHAINASTAAPLYAAICADTGCFRYSSVTAQTYRKAAVLIETGIPFSDIAAQMIAQKTPREVRAIRASYELLTLRERGAVATVLFPAKRKAELDLTDDDLGILSSLPKEIDGVRISIVIKQTDADLTAFKVSVRSDDDIPANELCALFGGGGHRCAAGATVHASSPEAAEQTVLSAFLAFLREKELL